MKEKVCSLWSMEIMTIFLTCFWFHRKIWLSLKYAVNYSGTVSI